MTEFDRRGGSEDPLEVYRQALMRQQSGAAVRAGSGNHLASREAPPAALDAAQDVADFGGETSSDPPPVPIELEPLSKEPEDLGSESEDFGSEPEDLWSEPEGLASEPADLSTESEDLPSDLEDTYNRYQKALDRLKSRQEEVAEPPAATLEIRDEPRSVEDEPAYRSEDEPAYRSEDEPAYRSEDHTEYQSEARTAGRSEDPLARYRQAVRQHQDTREAKYSAKQAASRETLNQFRKARNKRPDTPPESQAASRPSRGRRQVHGAPLDWRVRAVVFAVLLVASPPVQWYVHTRLGAPFTLADLIAGLSAVLPAALILFSARPGSFKGRFVAVVGSIAVALIGSAGFAYGLSLLQNELPDGASLALGLLLSLGVFTAVWGPLFLILAPVLSSVTPAAHSRT